MLEKWNQEVSNEVGADRVRLKVRLSASVQKEKRGKQSKTTKREKRRERQKKGERRETRKGKKGRKNPSDPIYTNPTPRVTP